MNSAPLKSAIYTGNVHHCRYAPKVHEFSYPIYMFSLDLDEIGKITESIRYFKSKRFSPLTFKREDYLGDSSKPLKTAVVDQVKSLGGVTENISRVVLLGQIRCFGFYFSPVNFYFCYEGDNARYMLAEVHNTPWNEMHCYLVNVNNPQSQKKEFHVSPFMGMDMNYEWRIQLAPESVTVHIENWQQEKLFDATLNLSRQPLDNDALKVVLKHWPMMTMSIVKGIYWQATKLFIKRTPYHSHP